MRKWDNIVVALQSAIHTNLTFSFEMIPPLDGAFPFPWLSFQKKNSKQTMQRDKMSDDKPFEKQETIETSLFQVVFSRWKEYDIKRVNDGNGDITNAAFKHEWCDAVWHKISQDMFSSSHELKSLNKHAKHTNRRGAS